MKTLINELANKGIKAEIKTVVKNGVEVNGLEIHTGTNTHPVVYENSFEGKSLEEQVIMIQNIVKDCPIFDVSAITDKDYILQNVLPCLQKKSDEDIVKDDFADLELYYRLKVQEDASCKVTNGLMESAKISKEELRESAYKNLKSVEKLISMAEYLGLHMEIPMWVVITENGVNGASIISDFDFMNECAIKIGTPKLVVIPSSIHECILMPYSDDMDSADVDMIINCVNADVVNEQEQLSNHRYIYDSETSTLTF